MAAQLTHKPLHALAPSLFAEPALLRMSFGTLPYRDVFKAFHKDMAILSAVTFGACGLAAWALSPRSPALQQS